MILRACSVCGRLSPEPRCPAHARKPWEASKRRERTVSGSRQQKRARFVLLKYDGICHVCGKAGADEVDHVVPLAEGGPDEVENLRPIHAKPCHRDKTAREAQRGRRR